MSLKRAAAGAVKWTGGSAAIVESLRFARLIVLARLLGPADFGLMAMVTVVNGFSEIFIDAGVSTGIIHRQDTTRHQLSSLYWLNLMAGAAVFALIVAGTPLAVQLYGEPRVAEILLLTALGFLIAPIGQQFRYLLQKELDFKRIAQVEVMAALSGTVVAVWSAVSGQGVFSLVWGQLATVTTRSAMLARHGWKVWRPSLHFSLRDLKGYVSFGVYQMAGRVTQYLANNVDYLFIGRFLGAEALGMYTLAYRIVVLPLRKLNPVLVRVAFPIFAKKQQDNAALRRGYLAMIRLISFIAFPLLVGAAVTAPVLVPAVLGEKWLAALPLIQILALLGILKSLVSPQGSIALAKGRPDLILKWSLIMAIVNTGTFWFVVGYGTEAVAIAWVLLMGVYFLAAQRMVVGALIELSLSEYMRALLGPTLLSAAMGGALIGAYVALQELSVREGQSLPALVALGVLVYGSLMLLFERQYLKENWRLFANKAARI